MVTYLGTILKSLEKIIRNLLMFSKLLVVLLREIEEFWINIRNFAFKHKTILEGFFIAVYSIEQIILIILVFNWRHDIDMLQLVISIFAVIILGTFAFHKLVMESRIRVLENMVNEALTMKIWLDNKTKKVFEESNQILLTKGLNKSKTEGLYDKKRVIR